MAINVRAYCNCDDTFIAWKLDAPIPGLRGFALIRERAGVQEIVPTWVGPEGETAQPGDNKPSTVWPIQKFHWTDYLARAGDTVRYRVVPMTGTMSGPNKSLARRDDLASPWTPSFTIGPKASKNYSAYFNRGIVATQWLARRLNPGDAGLAEMSRKLDDVVETANDPIRNFLGGPIRDALLDLLGDAAKNKRKVYAALYELEDVEILPALAALKKNAYVVLANGSVKKKGVDQNKEARKALKGKVNLYDRMCSPTFLGHNKFAVVCDAQGKPEKVWTGSTNWTKTGLCTQANNAVLCADRKIAEAFKKQWDLLKAAKNASPESLLAANSKPRLFSSDKTKTTVWFTRTADLLDLEQAVSLINGARQGLLFLMFNPGPAGTLLNAIIERSSPASPFYGPDLYMQGVINQDPSTTKTPVGLVHRGKHDPAPLDVLLPAAVTKQLAFWQAELKKKNQAFAMVHSKVVVLDPFGKHPVVMTGSHNLGPKASSKNDENFLIIENNAGIAAAYAVNIMSIYNQYRWRFRMTQPNSGASSFAGTKDNDTWQHYYFDGFPAREIDFWLGVR